MGDFNIAKQKQDYTDSENFGRSFFLEDGIGEILSPMKVHGVQRKDMPFFEK